MATIRQVLAGLEILAKYGDTDDVSCDHDELLAGGPSPEGMSLSDAYNLDKDGWLYDEQFESWKRHI